MSSSDAFLTSAFASRNCGASFLYSFSNAFSIALSLSFSFDKSSSAFTRRLTSLLTSGASKHSPHNHASTRVCSSGVNMPIRFSLSALIVTNVTSSICPTRLFSLANCFMISGKVPLKSKASNHVFTRASTPYVVVVTATRSKDTYNCESFVKSESSRIALRDSTPNSSTLGVRIRPNVLKNSQICICETSTADGFHTVPFATAGQGSRFCSFASAASCATSSLSSIG